MPMRKYLGVGGLALLLVALPGCGAMMHPRAGEFLEQAKGATGLETLTNLLARMETSAKAARAGQDTEANLSTLHDQQYAFRMGLCGVTETQARTPAFAKLATLTAELRPIMHRLMHHRGDAAVRDIHLDLYLKRIGELKEALSAVRG
jgi:hypothetical protein